MQTSPAPEESTAPRAVTAPAPRLDHQESGRTVFLTIKVDARYSGHTVYFFRRSGQTGRVAPLGTGEVSSGGYAFRAFDGKIGQILAVYGKVLGAPDIETPYSNTAAFKLR